MSDSVLAARILRELVTVRKDIAKAKATRNGYVLVQLEAIERELKFLLTKRDGTVADDEEQRDANPRDDV